MAVWLIRAGSQGEFEQRFLNENRVYLTWDGLNKDVSEIKLRDQLIDVLGEIDPDAKLNKLRNHASQIWPFAHDMKVGDRVIFRAGSYFCSQC